MYFDFQTIKFDHFGIQAGSDATGVATDMISMNATVKFLYRNTASFFGVHVTSTPLDLSFSELTIGSGAVSILTNFYPKSIARLSYCSFCYSFCSLTIYDKQSLYTGQGRS